MLEVILYITDVVLLLVLVVMARQLYRAFRHQMAPSSLSEIGQEVDLPSVTVCIPARNEQHALTDCLHRVLASTYPKLEIIVLDDDSSDNTSALIKAFASEGVRFVQGGEPKEGWLGKNYALQELSEEASGSYLLFLDVDTVLAPRAIENIVRYSLSHRKPMISVLPRREDNWRASVIMSPLRYFWEIIFQRRLSPASASNLWLIRKDILLSRFDGFKSLKNTIQPESKIAAELVQSDEYQFLIGTEAFGVAYEKKWRSQLLTGARLVFPILSKQVSLAVVVIIDLAVFLVPFVVLITVALWVETHTLLIVINLVLCLSYCGLYGVYTKHVWNKGWVLGALMWPILVIQELMIIIASVLQYQRSTVKWKGRPIRPEAQN